MMDSFPQCLCPEFCWRPFLWFAWGTLDTGSETKAVPDPTLFQLEVLCPTTMHAAIHGEGRSGLVISETSVTGPCTCDAVYGSGLIGLLSLPVKDLTDKKNLHLPQVASWNSQTLQIGADRISSWRKDFIVG